MRMTRLRKRKQKFFGAVMEFNRLIWAVSGLIFAAGVIGGVFILNGISDGVLGQLYGIWDIAARQNYKDGALEGFIKCGAAVLLIWLCGFFKKGIIGVISIIFLKGISIGFTSAFIIKCTSSIWTIFRVCFFREFFIMFLCFAAAVFAVRKNAGDKNFIEKKRYCAAGGALLTGTIIVCMLF